MAECGIFAAVRLCRGVGLAVGSQGALRAANDTFNQTWGQSQTAGLWMLDIILLHGSTRPLKAPVSSHWSCDKFGVSKVGADCSGLIGAWYL